MYRQKAKFGKFVRKIRGEHGGGTWPTWGKITSVLTGG